MDKMMDFSRDQTVFNQINSSCLFYDIHDNLM